MKTASPQDWPFDVRPLTPDLGAQIVGVDLANELDDEVFRAIYRAFLRYQVLLFGPLELPPARQVSFGRRFGEVQIHVMNQYHADGFPELYRLSNLDENGRPSGKHPDRGTLAWHTDGSWRRVTGQATIIYGEVVAGVGATRISATCTVRTIGLMRRGKLESTICAPCTTWTFPAPGGTARIP